MSAAHAALGELAIVLAYGKTLVGRLGEQDGRAVLEPAYELQASFGKGPKGPILIHMAWPIAMLGSWRGVTLPVDALITDASKLAVADRDALIGAILRCEQFLDEMRAAQAGIVRADGATKLPPPPGVGR